MIPAAKGACPLAAGGFIILTAFHLLQMKSEMLYHFALFSRMAK